MYSQKQNTLFATSDTKIEYWIQKYEPNGQWRPIFHTEDEETPIEYIQTRSSPSDYRIVKKTITTVQEQYWPIPMCSHNECKQYAARGYGTCISHIADCL